MPFSIRQKEELQLANHKEYGELYQEIPFIQGTAIKTKLSYRENLLSRLAQKAVVGYHGTKLDIQNLSPGCRLCAEGSWSCLFINGICNGRCFYCPTSQEDVSVPMTNTISFEEPDKYLAYLKLFKFKGVSISGGEPLITLDKTLAFIEAVKEELGENVYIWLYTNGILFNESIAASLKQAGLDEIRFDIGAVDYSLEKAAMAVKFIPRVTVEIPAVPEDLPILKMRLKEMAQLGIQHLNLHQLRLTPYNFPKLIQRGYTFLHGAKVTILDSELAALELIDYQQENAIPVGINYCSFVYKNRYQHKAARIRAGASIKESYEDLTSSGYIRTLGLRSDSGLLDLLKEKLQEADPSGKLWKLEKGSEKVYFSFSLWDLIKPDLYKGQLEVAYAESVMRSQVSYRNFFKDFRLNEGNKLYIEKIRKTSDLILNVHEAEAWAKLLSACDLEGEQDFIHNNPRLEECTRYEEVPYGLQEYF